MKSQQLSFYDYPESELMGIHPYWFRPFYWEK
jgi:hypothetical protein